MRKDKHGLSAKVTSDKIKHYIVSLRTTENSKSVWLQNHAGEVKLWLLLDI